MAEYYKGNRKNTSIRKYTRGRTKSLTSKDNKTDKVSMPVYMIDYRINKKVAEKATSKTKFEEDRKSLFRSYLDDEQNKIYITSHKLNMCVIIRLYEICDEDGTSVVEEYFVNIFKLNEQRIPLNNIRLDEAVIKFDVGFATNFAIYHQHIIDQVRAILHSR